MFFGRETELDLMKAKYASPKSELAVIYGRRRIGKTSLINQFVENKPYLFTFEGIEGERSEYQINQFANKLIAGTGDPFLESTSIRNWDTAFTYLTEKIIKIKRRQKKFILFFDEIQWMASGRSRLIATIKYFWDNFWKDQNVMLILCGSIASFMVKKVISSKALYGRISTEILLKGLMPHEASKIFKGKRGKEEILKYQLIFGGVPKYLEDIDLNRSVSENINALCFSANSTMINEIGKIFYSQFRKAENYPRIVNLLKNRLFTLDEIASHLGKKSGGSLRQALRDLENAEIIKSYVSFDKNWKTKFRKYRLSDEYLIFYFKFIEPHLGIISERIQTNLFELITKDNLNIWFGFAFERFCVKHALYLAQLMGFANQVISFAPYFSKDQDSFQVDLIYKRADNVITVCEVKYRSKEIKTDVIREMERKILLLKKPRGYTVEKALISLYGPDKHLETSGYFNHLLRLDDIIPTG